jgi:hypothetical protein
MNWQDKWAEEISEAVKTLKEENEALKEAFQDLSKRTYQLELDARMRRPFKL